jgi:hypothetical protein
MKKLIKIVNINPKKINGKYWESITRTPINPLKPLIPKIEIFVLFYVEFLDTVLLKVT